MFFEGQTLSNLCSRKKSNINTHDMRVYRVYHASDGCYNLAWKQRDLSLQKHSKMERVVGKIFVTFALLQHGLDG